MKGLELNNAEKYFYEKMNETQKAFYLSAKKKYRLACMIGACAAIIWIILGIFTDETSRFGFDVLIFAGGLAIGCEMGESKEKARSLEHEIALYGECQK